MADTSEIEWCDATWQILSGCTPASAGCRLCYSAKLAGTRLKHHHRTKGLTKRAGDGRFVFNGKVRFNEELLDWPLAWGGSPIARKEERPTRIFVADRSDIFHPKVKRVWLDSIFNVMDRAVNHVFIVLTKRTAAMRKYVNRRYGAAGAPKHIWLGTSIEDQKNADIRVPELLATRAAVRWISAEPLLGPITLLHKYLNPFTPSIQWMVVGGESGGPKAKPMHPGWVKSLLQQCRIGGVQFYFKQWGEWVTELESPEDIVLPGISWTPGTANKWPDKTTVYRVGKKRAGRLLGGQIYDDYPKVA